jgi:hypothetical protein
MRCSVTARIYVSPNEVICQLSLSLSSPSALEIASRRTLLSSSLHITRLTAVVNSQVLRHSPVRTFQSFIMLSAEPERRKVDVAVEVDRREGGRKGSQSLL